MTTRSGAYQIAPTYIAPCIAEVIEYGTITVESFLASCIPVTVPEILNDTCGICQLPLTTDEAIHNPLCNHILHQECTEQLLIWSRQCPYCRVQWISDEVDDSIADRIRYSLRSLENTGRMDLSSLPFELGHDGLRILLIMGTRNAAYCMEVQDVEKFGGVWDDSEEKRCVVEEEGVIREVAKSHDGYHIVRCLNENLVLIEDLRWYGPVNPEVYELSMRSSLAAWDLIRLKVQDSVERAEVEPGYFDIWILSARLIEAATRTWMERFGRDELGEPLARFLAKVAIWSLVSCTDGLYPNINARI